MTRVPKGKVKVKGKSRVIGVQAKVKWQAELACYLASCLSLSETSCFITFVSCKTRGQLFNESETLLREDVVLLPASLALHVKRQSDKSALEDQAEMLL